MLELLKSSLGLAKDYAEFKLPDWFKQFFAIFLFLVGLVIASGMVYYSFAIQSSPPALRVELARVAFRLNDYLLCGLDSLASFAPSLSQMKDVIWLFAFSMLWLLINVVLGFTTVLARFFTLLLRGHFDDPFLEMNEARQRKAEDTLKRLREDEYFASKESQWKLNLAGIMLAAAILRGVLVLLPLFGCETLLLLINFSAMYDFDLAAAMQGLLNSSNQGALPGLRELLMQWKASLWPQSGFCLVWAWITFRYSFAGRSVRFILLLLATTNVLFLAGQVGEVRGLERIQLRKVRVESSKLKSHAELQEAELLFLREDEGRLVLYSCDMDRVISVQAAEVDLIFYGPTIGIGDICSRR